MKKESFMENLNLFLCGAVLGAIIVLCFCVNHYENNDKKQKETIRAYEKYYKYTETMLDSIDGEHNLDLMDTDLCTDYGEDYLQAKSVVDSLVNYGHNND